MRRTAVPIILLALLLPACVATQEAAIHATAPKQDEKGIGVGANVNAPFGNANITLSEVGTYDRVSKNWTGPLPPGWTPNNVEIAKAEAAKAQALADKAAAELELAKLKAQLAPAPGEDEPNG